MNYVIVYAVLVYTNTAQLTNIYLQELHHGEIKDYNEVMKLEREALLVCSMNKCNMPQICSRVLQVTMVNRFVVGDDVVIEPLFKGQMPEIDRAPLNTVTKENPTGHA
jgi:hypothetical protein